MFDNNIDLPSATMTLISPPCYFNNHINLAIACHNLLQQVLAETYCNLNLSLNLSVSFKILAQSRQNNYHMKMEILHFDCLFVTEKFFDWLIQLEMFFDDWGTEGSMKIKLIAYRLKRD